MYLFIFLEVLQDWTYGMATVVAHDKQEAINLAVSELGEYARNDFDTSAFTCYKLADSVPIGLKDYQYGGA